MRIFEKILFYNLILLLKYVVYFIVIKDDEINKGAASYGYFK